MQNKKNPKRPVNPPNIKNYRTMKKEHQKIYDLLLERDHIKENLIDIKKKIENEKKTIIKKIESDVTFDWCWKYTTKCTIIKWKEVFIDYMDKKEADKVSANTPEKEYKHLGIKFYDPLPKQKSKKPFRVKLKRKINL